jgi:carbon storage regulator CsrA
MLVLSRKLGETIRIGDVCLKVTGIQGSRVKLGFEGPSDIQILRGELVEQWQELSFDEDRTERRESRERELVAH